MDKIFRKGSLAVITGGASGIGLSLAQRCLAAGMSVIVGDRDQIAVDSLNKTYGHAMRAFKMDVAQQEDWATLRRTIDNEYSGLVALLALNAGIKPECSFDDVSSFQTTFNTNVFGVVAGISSLLPCVKANVAKGNPSSVVITGSKQGITNPPGYPAYNASKAATKVIAEQLHYDLSNIQGLSVHLLIPGWTHTGMNGRASQDETQKPDGAWWPEQVVDYLEQKMLEHQFWVICPDNEVSEPMDQKRMTWSAGDAVEGRPPLSRWREEYKEDFDAFARLDT